MRIAFCTLFDRAYLARGVTMIRSLRRHLPAGSQQIFALCLDDVSHGWLSSLGEPGVHPVAIATLEATDPDLTRVRPSRTRAEYCFTLSPILPLYVLDAGGFDAVVSLDADLCFFSDPSPHLEHLAQRSIFITRHAFTAPMRAAGLRTGVFNVSFQGFRNDATGRACLNQWRRQCLERCSREVDDQNQTYADQRYLDTWPEDFPGQVTILEPPAAGLAPWNLRDFPLSFRDGRIAANGQYPTFFHFHGLQFLGRHRVANSLWRYHAVADRICTEHLYKPYLRELAATESACCTATGTHIKAEPDTLWNRWKAQTFFEMSGDTCRSVDLSAFHPLQQSWRLFRSLLIPG